MANTKPGNTNIPNWVLIALSVAMPVVGLIGVVLMTFTIEGEPSGESSASAAAFVFSLAIGTLVATVGLLPRKIAVATTLSTLALLYMAVRCAYDIGEGGAALLTHSPVSIIGWCIGGIVLAIPLMLIGLQAAKVRSETHFRSCLVLGATALVLLLIWLVIPEQQSINRDYAQRAAQQEISHQQSLESDKEEAAYQAQEEQESKDLRAAARQVVVNISDQAHASGTLPTSVAAPAGYTLVEYVVQDKSKARFCLQPTDFPDLYLGVVVDPEGAGRNKTLYWRNLPYSHCEYDYANDFELEP